MADSIMTDDEYEYEYDSDADSQDDDEDTSSSNNNKHDYSGGNPNAPPVHFTSITTTTNSNIVTMLSAKALAPELEARFLEVTEALGVTTDVAAPLLRGHQWSLQSLLQQYSNHPKRVLEQAGVAHRCRHLLTSSTTANNNNNNNNKKCKVNTDCLICMEPILNNNQQKSLSMSCGHDFCLDCWEDYLSNCIQAEGATCVVATCPQAGCSEVITESTVQQAAPQLVSSFQYYQLQSFVESNPLLRWCPGKGCDQVAQAHPAVLGDTTVTLQADCRGCGSSFCFGCGEEPHLPAACQQLAQWQEKNQNESETNNWVLANTKTCPKCAARIHKDGGCMYVRCAKCQHGFCWVCMGTHHVQTCNSFPDKNADNDGDVARAKNELERYLHYYERYHGHESAQKFAKTQFDNLQVEDANTTTTMDHHRPGSREEDAVVVVKVDLRLLMSANQQLIHCRRVLKYSYVFAYYHYAKCTLPAEKLQKECFEHHQGILEGLTEGLSKVAELPRVEIDPQDLTNRSRVIHQFIKNLLEYVGNGMV